MHKVRFDDITRLMPYSPPDSEGNVNLLLEDDYARLKLRPEQFDQFVFLLNNIKAWKYPDPIPDYHSQQNRLMIGVYYQDGRQWVLGSDSRFE